MNTAMVGRASHVDARVARGAFAELAGRTRQAVDERLREVFDRSAAEAAIAGSQWEPEAWAAIDAARDLTLRGGKRLRAALVAVGYMACGGEPNDAAVVTVGAAVELLQTYLLIHDDWMDGDELRRGGPSVHAVLRARYGDMAVGDAAAVLAGDYVSALAQQTLSSAPASPSRLLDTARVFAGIHRDVILGQLADTLPDAACAIEVVHDLKTTSYTVRGPLLLGAALAGAAQPLCAALEAYATPLGGAFQVRDDLLGTFGDPRETGKPVGNDLRSGKRTAILSALDPKTAASPRLARVLGVKFATDEDVGDAVRLLSESGVRARVERRVSDLLEQARRALVDAPLTPAGLLLLHGAISALGERSR